MSDTAEMMLDGTLCEGCGEYLGGTEHDVPLLCDGCAQARRRDGREIRRAGRFWQDVGAAGKAPPPLKVRCPTCRKRVKVVGLADHARVVHATGQAPAEQGGRHG